MAVAGKAGSGSAKSFRFGNKVKDGATKEAGVKQYAGPNPPAGPYRVAVKQLTIKENKNGDNMLAFVAEINESGANKKYNGFPVFGQQNITDQGAGYVNQLLNALFNDNQDAVDEFWSGAVKTKRAEKKDKNGKDVYHVRSIGDDFPVGSPDRIKLEMVIVGKAGKWDGKYKLDVTGYSSVSAVDDAMEEGDELVDGVPEDDDAEEQDVDEADSSEDEVDDEGDDEDDDADLFDDDED